MVYHCQYSRTSGRGYMLLDWACIDCMGLQLNVRDQVQYGCSHVSYILWLSHRVFTMLFGSEMAAPLV